MSAAFEREVSDVRATANWLDGVYKGQVGKDIDELRAAALRLADAVEALASPAKLAAAMEYAASRANETRHAYLVTRMAHSFVDVPRNRRDIDGLGGIHAVVRPARRRRGRS